MAALCLSQNDCVHVRLLVNRAGIKHNIAKRRAVATEGQVAACAAGWVASRKCASNSGQKQRGHLRLDGEIAVTNGEIARDRIATGQAQLLAVATDRDDP